MSLPLSIDKVGSIAARGQNLTLVVLELSGTNEDGTAETYERIPLNSTLDGGEMLCFTHCNQSKSNNDKRDLCASFDVLRFLG